MAENESGAQVSDGAPIATNDSTQVHAGNWREFLPPSVQDWQEVKQSDTAEKFFDQVANMRKFIGQSIRIPTQDAGQEQMEQFYNRLQEKVPGLMRTPDPEDAQNMAQVMRTLGVPDDDSEYNFDGAATDEQVSGLRQMAKDLGLTKKQFKKFAETMVGAETLKSQQSESAINTTRQELQKQWGAAYDERMQDILNIAEATKAAPQLIQAINDKTIDANTAQWLWQMGKQLGGEAINAHVQQKQLSPAEASENINDILGNSAHPYWNADHPGHKAAVDKVLNLQRLAMASN